MMHHPYLDRPLRSELDVAREKLEGVLYTALARYAREEDGSYTPVLRLLDCGAIAYWEHRVAALEGRA